MKQQKLQEQIEDAGCPYFFEEDCGRKMTSEIFDRYCLDKYKECHTYQFIQNEGDNFVGSKK